MWKNDFVKNIFIENILNKNTIKYTIKRLTKSIKQF